MPSRIKKEQPLKSDRKVSQTRKSDLTAELSLTRCCGRLMPTVKSISRRRNARPGRTTEHAKFKSPIRDCNSCRVTFFRVRNAESKSTHRSTLSEGRRPQSEWYQVQYRQMTKPQLDLQFFRGHRYTQIVTQVQKTRKLTGTQRPSGSNDEKIIQEMNHVRYVKLGPGNPLNCATERLESFT